MCVYVFMWLWRQYLISAPLNNNTKLTFIMGVKIRLMKYSIVSFNLKTQCFIWLILVLFQMLSKTSLLDNHSVPQLISCIVSVVIFCRPLFFFHKLIVMREKMSLNANHSFYGIMTRKIINRHNLNVHWIYAPSLQQQTSSTTIVATSEEKQTKVKILQCKQTLSWL